MNRLIFLLFASLLVLSACGNEKEKEEPKKETKSKEKNVDKDKENRKKKDKENQDKEVAKQPQQQSDEQPNSQEQTVEMPQQQNNNGYQQPEQQASQNYASQQETPVVNKNTVTEYYNGQTHTQRLIIQSERNMLKEKPTLFTNMNINTFIRQKKLKEQKRKVIEF